MDLWDWSLVEQRWNQVRGVLTVKAVMWTFQFLFSCYLSKIISKQTDNLGKEIRQSQLLTDKK